MAIALPALEEAKTSVSSIKTADLVEMKKMANPPKLVKMTCTAVACMITAYYKKDELDWRET